MSWLDKTEYNPKEICPLCLGKYTKAKGVYQILPCKPIVNTKTEQLNVRCVDLIRKNIRVWMYGHLKIML